MAWRRAHQRVDDEPLQSSLKKTREWLFTRGYAVSSVHLKRVLDSRSLTPMQVCAQDHHEQCPPINPVVPQSAFSVRLNKVDPAFNFYQMFAPDLLHEFELGVWKGVFTHLLRLLFAQGKDTVQEFDRRYVRTEIRRW